LLGNRKKIAKFLMKTFTYRSTFLYDFTRYLFVQVEAAYKGLSANTVKAAVGRPDGPILQATKQGQSAAFHQALLHEYRHDP
jgi:hypothetical protein